MKYYVAADVHGFYTILHDTLEREGCFSDPEPHRLILLGDCFDRGGEAEEMQRFLLELLEKDALILIRGNHEDLFVDLSPDRRFDNFLTACVRPAKSDIVVDRVLKQIHSLEHHTDIVHKICNRNITDICSTDFYTALFYIPEACNQHGQCCFARAG